MKNEIKAPQFKPRPKPSSTLKDENDLPLAVGRYQLDSGIMIDTMTGKLWAVFAEGFFEIPSKSFDEVKEMIKNERWESSKNRYEGIYHSKI